MYQYLREKAPDEEIHVNSTLYKHLQNKAPELLEGSTIKWNFTKFLIDQKGMVVKRFSPITTPEEIAKDIEALLAK